MADILLIQPPIRDFYLTAKRTIPYGLASIGAALMREGFSVEILDCLATRKSKVIEWPAEMRYLEVYYGQPDISPFGLFHRYRHYGLSFGKITDAVRRVKPFLVGISSLFSAYAEEALETAKAVRAAGTGCTIVMGGHHPTEMFESVMECEAVDYVLRGEGEPSLPVLARALAEGRGIEAVPGIVYRAADGVESVPGIVYRTGDGSLRDTADGEPRAVASGGLRAAADGGLPVSVGGSSRAAASGRSKAGADGALRGATGDRGLQAAVNGGLHVAADGGSRAVATGGLHVGSPVVMEDPDRYPLPAMGLIDGKFYRRGPRGGAVVVASRGCPLRCTYCSIGGADWLKYRQRSVDSVLREIEVAVNEFGAGFIDFEDENISLHKPWFMKLLDGIVARFGAGKLELRAMNGLFPPSLDAETVNAMKETGFTALNLSLGSACPEQLRRFGRPDVREAFDRALASAARCDMGAVGYIIVGAPGQSPTDSVDDLLYLAERPVVAGISVYYPAPGSADYARCARAGLFSDHFSLMRATAVPISDTTTRDESVTLLRLGRILNFMKSLEVGELAEVWGECAEAEGELAKAGEPAGIRRCAEVLDRQGSGDARNEPAGPFGKGAVTGDRRQGEAASGAPSHDPTVRIEAGKALLRHFLSEGRLLGMTPAGATYPHGASQDLCDRFLVGLSRIRPGRVSLDRPKNRMI